MLVHSHAIQAGVVASILTDEPLIIIMAAVLGATPDILPFFAKENRKRFWKIITRKEKLDWTLYHKLHHAKGWKRWLYAILFIGHPELDRPLHDKYGQWTKLAIWLQILETPIDIYLLVSFI